MSKASSQLAKQHCLSRLIFVLFYTYHVFESLKVSKIFEELNYVLPGISYVVNALNFNYWRYLQNSR